MSLISTLHTGRTGLRAASSGLTVTGHNVANASTDGYSKRTLQTVTKDPVQRYGIFYGEGVDLSHITRSSNRFLGERLVETTGDYARAESSVKQLTIVESNFDENNASGVAQRLEKFFDELEALTTDPSDTSLRIAVTAAANGLAESVNRAADRFGKSLDDISQEMEDTLIGVQVKLDQVGELNALVKAGGGNLGAGDYADQRDQIVAELAETIGVTVDIDADGVATLFLGGHAIVDGPEARQLAFSTSPTTGPKVTVSADSGTLNVTRYLSGTFGGLVDAYTTTDAALSDLNDFASDFADLVNTQHALGFDASGTAGGAVFSYTAGTAAESLRVDASLASDPSLWALAGAATAAAGDGDNLNSLIDLQDTDAFDGATKTATEFVAKIYGDIGNAVLKAELQYEQYETELDDLSELRDAISGVDLDEEAVDLMEWQASYQASSRVITATNELLGELMEIV